MVAATKSGACVNLLKNAFFEDFTVEVLTAAVGSLRAKLTDSIRFFISTNLVEGPENGRQALHSEPWGTLEAVTIKHALTHVRVGAVNGIMRVSGSSVVFCVVLEFANLKCESISTVKVYRI